MAINYTFGKFYKYPAKIIIQFHDVTLMSKQLYSRPVAPDPVRWQSYEVSKINLVWTAVPEAVAY